MKLAIRVDGNSIIGAGHATRCLTIAYKLKEYGFESTFFMRNVSDNISTKISKSFDVIYLKNECPNFTILDDYSKWLGVTEEIDAYDFLLNAQQEQFDLVIVDHYGIGKIWEEIVSKQITKIIVIDDLANRKHFADLLIDQSIGRKSRDYRDLIPKKCKLLAGTKYALLRDEFRDLDSASKKKFDIVISFGGVDKNDFTLHVVNLLAMDASFLCYRIKVLIGKDYPFTENLRDRIEKLNSNIEVIENPDNFAAELGECRVAIGAGGGSLLERSALGIPSILYPIAENQEHICAEYVKQGLGFMLRRGATNEAVSLIMAIEQFLKRGEWVDKSLKNKSFVDMRGAERVVIEILDKFKLINYYDAKIEDEEFVYNCRYFQSDALFYKNKNVPNYHQHQIWYSQSLLDGRLRHIIFVIEGIKLGYVRLDTDNELSVYVYPTFRGKGLAELMIRYTCKKYRSTKLHAYVHKNNFSSLNAFLKNKFQVISTDTEFTRLEKC